MNAYPMMDWVHVLKFAETQLDHLCAIVNLVSLHQAMIVMVRMSVFEIV